MGTCCASCLAAKIRDYAPNAQNGAVTVTLIKNSQQPSWHGSRIKGNVEQGIKALLQWLQQLQKCDICGETAKFQVSFFQKYPGGYEDPQVYANKNDDDPTKPDTSLRRVMKERK